MADRCKRTELLVDQCGCVDHRGGHTPDEEAASVPAGPWFTARFAGYCPRCGSEYSAGDRIRARAYAAGGWECCT